MLLIGKQISCKAIDTTPFEDVFKTYRKGSADEVNQKLEALPKEYEKGIRKSQAFLALQDRRADVLKLCFEKGNFAYESYFEDEANTVGPEKDPETLKVLEESHFRKIFPRKDNRPSSPENENSLGLFGKTEREQERLKELHHRARTFDAGGSHPVDW